MLLTFPVPVTIVLYVKEVLFIYVYLSSIYTKMDRTAWTNSIFTYNNILICI